MKGGLGHYGAIVAPAELGELGEELGAGNQGTVRTVSSHPGLVYKRYKESSRPRLLDLDAVTRVARTAAAEGNHALVEVGAWPVNLVADGTAEPLVGITMPAIPDDYWLTTSRRHRKVCAWSTLTRENHEDYWRRGLEREPPSERDRLVLASEIVAIYRAILGCGLVVPDVAPSNGVFSPNDPARTVVFDLDDARWGEAPNRFSPGYEDPSHPTPGEPVGPGTSRYRIGLLTGRLLCGRTEPFPQDAAAWRQVADLAGRVTADVLGELCGRNGPPPPPGERPELDDLAAALEEARGGPAAAIAPQSVRAPEGSAAPGSDRPGVALGARRGVAEPPVSSKTTQQADDADRPPGPDSGRTATPVTTPSAVAGQGSAGRRRPLLGVLANLLAGLCVGLAPFGLAQLFATAVPSGPWAVLVVLALSVVAAWRLWPRVKPASERPPARWFARVATGLFLVLMGIGVGLQMERGPSSVVGDCVWLVDIAGFSVPLALDCPDQRGTGVAEVAEVAALAAWGEPCWPEVAAYVGGDPQDPTVIGPSGGVEAVRTSGVPGFPALCLARASDESAGRPGPRGLAPSDDAEPGTCWNAGEQVACDEPWQFFELGIVSAPPERTRLATSNRAWCREELGPTPPDPDLRFTAVSVDDGLRCLAAPADAGTRSDRPSWWEPGADDDLVPDGAAG